MKTGFKPRDTDKPIIYHESTKGIFRKRIVPWYKCTGHWKNGRDTGDCQFMGREDVFFTHLKEFHNCNPPEAREYMSKGEWE